MTVASYDRRNVFQIYTVLIFIRILLTWFPNIDWSNPIFSTLSQLTDPYLNIFRQVIPPLGGIDFSPMIAIFLLQIVAGLIPQFLYSLASISPSMPV
ncbi:MAG: YggT family protein [Oscillatoriales cyanobacterium RM1_1_9]|nr:YggT family protein [Oscillatoriales cyanobacterium RM1_1_9]